MDGQQMEREEQRGEKKRDRGMIGSYHFISLLSGFLMMKAIIHTKSSKLPSLLSSFSFVSFFCLRSLSLSVS